MASVESIVVSPGVSLPISAANVSAGAFPGAAYSFAGDLTVALNLRANRTIEVVSATIQQVFTMAGATTGPQFIRAQSTGASLLIGIDNDAGNGLLGGAIAYPYNTTIATFNATALVFGVNGGARMAIVPGGAVTVLAGVPFQLGNANTLGAVAQTGFVTMQDSLGATVRVLTG